MTEVEAKTALVCGFKKLCDIRFHVLQKLITGLHAEDVCRHFDFHSCSFNFLRTKK